MSVACAPLPMEFNALQHGYRSSPNYAHSIEQRQMHENPPMRTTPYGVYPPASDSTSHQYPVQRPIGVRDTWPSGVAYEFDAPTAQKRRHACMYNAPINDFSSAPEGQNVIPRPMSMQSQFSQQLSVGDVSEQTESLHPAQPSLELWDQKPLDSMDPSNIDIDTSDLHQDFANLEDDSPVVHMRQLGALDNPSVSMSMGVDPTKRMSGSSFSMSTAGDFSSIEDLPPSEGVSHASDWESSFDPASTWMSPITSPRHSHGPFDQSRRGSRSRASPASQHTMRASPYGIGSDRSKRWTIGTSVPNLVPNSHSVSHLHDRFPTNAPRGTPYHSTSAYNLNGPHNHQPQTQNIYYPPSGLVHTANGVFYPPNELHPFQVTPRPLPSQGLFRMLHSNSDGHGHPFVATTEPSSPPDLYSSLNEPPEDPPEEDMHPSDPDLVPHEQDLRFAGDLYTPKWVRGHGNKREGWCGLCKPGRWLVLKNSAFWYDKSFTHGVSAATGAAFQGPTDTRRTEGNADVWEGHCGSCGDWISLVSSKKKGTTWFRHAYKCHTHPKVKDGPKRRRETPASMRARAASNASGTTGTSPAPRLRIDSDESPVSESEKQAQLDAEIRAHFQAQSMSSHSRTGSAFDGFAGMI